MNKYWWESLSDNQLLNTPLKELGIGFAGSWVESFARKVQRELAARGVHYKPYYWVSDDWYCPEGYGGVALPFYLLHPRLIRLEKKYIGRAEGSSPRELIKILRHEVGHAIENVYRLDRSPLRRASFGDTQKKYPSSYLPIKYSKNYVKHLPDNYAQSHPDEDFAETFAVWLTPKMQWKTRYQNWPALNKLVCMDYLMQQVTEKSVPKRSHKKMDDISSMDITLGQYFQKKKRRLKVICRDKVDEELRAAFSTTSSQQKLTSYLQLNKRKIQISVAKQIGQPSYVLAPLINNLLKRSKTLNLHIDEEAEVWDFITEKSLEFVYENRHKVYM